MSDTYFLYTKYTVEYRSARRHDFVVDDHIPCKPRKWWERCAEPLFAKTNGHELWAVILEKAFAKFSGSRG